METVSHFILGGSKITADGDRSHEIKRHLLLGRKLMTNLDSIFKSRDITLPTKVSLVKAMVFPMVFPSLAAKKRINVMSVLNTGDSMCRVFSCDRGVCYKLCVLLAELC